LKKCPTNKKDIYLPVTIWYSTIIMLRKLNKIESCNDSLTLRNGKSPAIDGTFYFTPLIRKIAKNDLFRSILVFLDYIII